MDLNHTYLVVIRLDSSTLKKEGNYYPQVFLKEFKYIKKKLTKDIIDDIESSFDDYNDFDEE